MWKTLVFIEIGSVATCEAKGIIWMDCFKSRVKQIRDKIHNFLFYGPGASLPSIYCPTFLLDMPFSPRCLFNKQITYCSRSTSVSGSESVSPQLPPPKASVNLTTHLEIKNLVGTSKEGRTSSQRVERCSLSLKSEYEDNNETPKKQIRRCVLLAEGYCTPASHSSATRTAPDSAPGIVQELTSHKPAEDTCA